MEGARPRPAAKAAMSSPPRSTKTGAAAHAPCVGDMVTRTFDLVTSREVIPFYILAAWFSFYYAPLAPSVPAPRGLDHVVFKVLPVVYLMELVRHPPQTVCPQHDHTRRYIILGQVLCSIGDGYLAYDPTSLESWAGFSCLGYLSYTIAFYQYYQSSKWSRLMFPTSAVLVAILIYLIQDLVTCAIIIVYASFITAMGFFALSRLEVCRTGSAYLGWAGVKLFILCDFLFALNFLVPSLERPVSDTIVSMAYYLGQLGVALSTYTINLCPPGEPSTSGKSASPARSDSTASVKATRSVSK